MSGALHFSPSPYTPMAMSFFGLALGYIIMGGQKFFRYPEQSPSTRRALGVWAFYGPGVVQSISAILLWVGLTWFGVFQSRPVNYVLALTFLALAAHWLAMGITRMRGASTELEAWMGMPLLALAVLTAWVLFAWHEPRIAVGFILLALVYAADSARAFHLFPSAERVQGALQFAAGWWMMYLVYATVLTITISPAAL